MANRPHVIQGLEAYCCVTIMLMALVSGCSGGPTEAVNRGRVIDQETGQGIAGAIVVGKYMGSRGPEGASSCNRVESAVSDQEGWFSLPTDPQGKPPFMEAYHRGFRVGISPRHAFNGAGPEKSIYKWQVQISQWDQDNKRAHILHVEPQVYDSEKEALEASREWKDVYLKQFRGTKEEWLFELRRLSTSCGGPPQTSDGLVPFLEAIYQEQLTNNESASQLERTHDLVQMSIRDLRNSQVPEKARLK